MAAGSQALDAGLDHIRNALLRFTSFRAKGDRPAAMQWQCRKVVRLTHYQKLKTGFGGGPILRILGGGGEFERTNKPDFISPPWRSASFGSGA